MRNRTHQELPGDCSSLDRVERQLTVWRRTHKPPCPLPEDIWGKATELAARLGVGKVARALRLDSAALKRRMEAHAPSPAATFVELLPFADHIGECTVEVESASGARLRLLMKHVAPGGLATIIRDFVGTR